MRFRDLKNLSLIFLRERDARTRYIQQDGKCFLCGERLDDTTNKDHLWPRHRGSAKKGWKHIVLVHERCNKDKGHQLPTIEQLERFRDMTGERWPISRIQQLQAMERTKEDG